MIRVNLLPQKRRAETRAEGKQLWLVAVMVMFLAEIAGLFVFPRGKEEARGAARARGSDLEAADGALRPHGGAARADAYFDARARAERRT